MKIKCPTTDGKRMVTIEAETIVTAILEIFFMNLGTKIHYPMLSSFTGDWYMAHSHKQKKKISSKILKIMGEEAKKYKGKR